MVIIYCLKLSLTLLLYLFYVNGFNFSKSEDHTVYPGSSIPSALVLWVTRELPPAEASSIQEESSTLAFVGDSPITVHNPQRWTTATSMQNQVPILLNLSHWLIHLCSAIVDVTMLIFVVLLA